MTPIADMIEQMLANNDPPAAIVAAVRAIELVTLRNVTVTQRNADVTRYKTRVRVQNYRNRKKSQQVAKANDVASSGGDVTVPAVTCPVTPIGKPLLTSSYLLPLEVPKKEKQEVVTRARATRMPAGAPLTEDFITTAVELGADRTAVPKIWAEFVDYWCALPGPRGTKLDWPATWRNRLRQIVSKGQKNGRQTVHDAAREFRRNLLLQTLVEPAPGVCEPEGGSPFRLLPPR